MNQHLSDRRRFLRLLGGLASTAAVGTLLSGCGGDDDAAAPVTVVPAPGTTVTNPGRSAVPVTAVAAAFNVLVNLEYVGAQFYAYAATGVGLPAQALTGIGTVGVVSGARKAAFADPALADAAAEMASARAARIDWLRAQAGDAAAAHPMVDLSPTGAFATVASGAGVASFDPFADDHGFLLGAFVMEHVVAAAYRGVLHGGTVGASTELQRFVAEAIYHASLVRSLIDDHAPTDPALGAAAVSIGRYLARLDGSDAGDQSLAMTDHGGSSTLADGADRPVPFNRTTAQVLRALQFGGGFLPRGANGVQASA